MKREILLQLGNPVGDGHPTFITFEAGPTIDGVENALALVDLAKRAGGDAIKFQFVDPDRLVPDRGITLDYDVLNKDGSVETLTEPVYDILSRRVLTDDEWGDVANHATSLGILMFATAEFEDQIDTIRALEFDSIKIASTDVNHLPLIRYAAETGLVIQLDTGNSTLGEIEAAIDTLMQTGNRKIIIHNVPSGYPAHLASINLNLITTLRLMFCEFPIAFSDHTPGWNMDIAAVALGANMVEKTITLDRTTRSPEHMMSVDPMTAAEFVSDIRAMEVAMGSFRRVISRKEKVNRMMRRRSAVLNQNVSSGTKLTDKMIIWQRPEMIGSVTPDMADEVWGKCLLKNVNRGEILMKGDLS